MKKNGRNSHWNIDFHIPGLNQEMGFAAGILTALFLFGGLLVWGCLFAMKEAGPVLVLELIVNLILLLANLYAICRIGYDGFTDNLKVTYAAEVFFTVIGFFIGRIHFLVIPGNGSDSLYLFLEFLLVVIFAVFASILPSIIISLIMWIIMSVFGKR